MPKVISRAAISSSTDDTEGAKARIFKLNAEEAATVLIQRENGYERQRRYHCPRCTLPIAYQTTMPPNKAPFLYLIRGSLTQYQGEVPPEAFIGEESC
ncbi:hypothetical protein Clacol_001634 [Clathrus columnatus]|uniref:STEEP1 domain-containing protein n=1 Tax=Clathrus columnatus TaxID=1419009 RepID=A0AAV5A1F9_9AGAM|nr:hypothetical protein Clacol_001634 [Clathrus columnatus]